MFPESLISFKTVQAYRETDYRVHGEMFMKLNIGVASLPLAACHAAHSVASSAYVTAWNPIGQALDAPANAARQAALVGELTAAGLTFIEGIGQHPTNGWPGEPSVLVLGLSRAAALALGMKYEQNAIVWCSSDAIPELVLLR